jgi:hypothetical protein
VGEMDDGGVWIILDICVSFWREGSAAMFIHSLKIQGIKKIKFTINFRIALISKDRCE